MPTNYFYGYEPDAFSSPEPGTMQLDPDWDVQDDAYDFHITDDDDDFQGDSNIDEVSDDGSQQTGVVYDANGNTIASGDAYLEEAYVLTDGHGNTVRLYRVEIGGTHVGYIADGPIQPGNTYSMSSTQNVDDSNAPAYSELEDQSYNQESSNNVSGTANDDTLHSGDGADTIAASDGDDVVDSGSGNDSVDGGAGADNVDGGSGNDSITGGSGEDTITGGTGDDTISGGANADNIDGSAGNDSISGGAGGDSLSGGSGNDTIFGNNGADTIDGGTGDDSIDGGGGDDLLTGGDEADTTISGSIGTDNYSETGNGYNVTAQNVSGGALTAASTSNVSTSGGGLGATGAVSDSDSGQANQLAFDKASGISERLIVDFDNDVTSASFSFQSLFTDGFGEVGHWAVYDDGVLVSEADFTEDSVGSGSGAVDLSGLGSFDQIVFTALLQTDGTDGSDYVITDVSYTMPTTETSNDTIAGGAGDDTIFGGTGDDSLSGEDDADTFILEDGFGSDTIAGGEAGTDSDTIDLSNLSGPVTVTYTGDEEGTITDGSDTLSFGEIERLTLTDHADVVDASADSVGVDIDGAGGSDTITGGLGADSIQGGNDADSLDGGDGDDSLTGGAGDDVFTVSAGHDTISDFNSGNTGTLDDGDSTNNDFINLSGYYDNLSELYADQADDGVLNQSNTTDSKGRSTDYSDNTQFGANDSMTFSGASADNSSFTEENTSVVCFTTGTAIRTPRGDVLIDDLRVGDLVCTMDNGPQRIRWIGRRTLGPGELAANPKVRPVLIKRGVMGAERDLLVSPQHGMLMPDQTLIRAKFLAEAKGNPVRIAHGRRSVTYIHLLFDEHQIIFAENTRSESFYPGKMALTAVDAPARDELCELFPTLCSDLLEIPESWYGKSARRYLKRRAVLRGGQQISL